MRFRDPSLSPQARVSALLDALTLEEKLVLCSGRSFWKTQPIPRLGIRALRATDGPRGIAFHSTGRRGTAFPSGIALGASWDPALARRVGAAIGQEAREAGAHLVLGPAVNLVRTPLGGRTFEYLTEDPHLGARLTAAFVQGVQSERVAACVKHFVANNQEARRAHLNVRVSQRALRELYLPAFEAAVREGGAWSIMSAYNAVNGTKCSENPRLLVQILREQWGFEGMVVSDWFAARYASSASACIAAGLSLAMPGRYSRYRMKDLRRALDEGRLRERDVDRALRGTLRLMVEIGHIDEPSRPRRRAISTPRHHALAREAAAAGMTLLRNEGRALPLDLDRIRTLAVVGPRARRREGWPIVGGSSAVWPPHEITPRRGLIEALGPRVRVVSSAARADAAVVCVGLGHRPGSDSEGFDRARFELPSDQVALIRRTAARTPTTIVVLMTGSPVPMPWADEVSAIVVAWHPGMEGGRALADVLTGAVNPAGRLPVTFPRALADSPAHRSSRTYPGQDDVVDYAEGVFVGYRHFDREALEPRFPFGHGLSYTRFEYRDLTIDPTSLSRGGAVDVAFTLANIGPRDGAEVAQLYVGDPSGRVPRPPRELRAFAKRWLRAGDQTRVQLRLTVRDLSYFDQSADGWRAGPGRFHVELGASSRDIRLRGSVELDREWFEAIDPTR